ncbi:MAG: ribonuclease P protein component [Alphaproteobacteria bacterium]|nr:ribonuclease P protein component [Alphaproteobacteria bacterium]
MKKNCRIRKRKEFLDIAQSGFYFKSGLIVVQCKANQSGKIRIGFTASKKVGNAVVRNRCKRRMRALADIVLSDAEGIIADYVFIARRNTASADWNSLVSEGNQAIAFLQKKMSAQCAHS